MAIANTRTQLSLDRWAEILQINPMHFNQVQLNDTDLACNAPIFQFGWQAGDHTSRENIANAIDQAERSIESYLGYPLVGRWIVDELHSFRNQNVLAQTRVKYVRYGGIEAKSLIDDAVAIVYSDSDTDGNIETATVTVNTTVTDAREIEIYYPGKSGEDAYEIRNTKVTITGGVATIVFKRAQCLLEKFLTTYEEPRAQLLSNNDAFLTTVDVYRRYNDPSTQLELQAFGTPCACGGDGCATCTYSVQPGCLRIVDSRNGLVALNASEWSAEDLAFYSTVYCSSPNKARLYYYAGLGYKGQVTVMDPQWERAVAYYALSLLERPICNCSHLSGLGIVWKEDLAVIEGFGGGARIGPMASVIKHCPLGTTRAALNAWRLIQQYQVGEAAIHA